MIGRFFVHRHIIKFNDFSPHTLQLTRLCCILNHPAYEWLLKRKEKRKSFREQYIFDSMNKNKRSLTT